MDSEIRPTTAPATMTAPATISTPTIASTPTATTPTLTTPPITPTLQPQPQAQPDPSVDVVKEENEKRSSWTESSTSAAKGTHVGVEEVATDDGIDWKPGFRHQFPWIGLAGLITVILATSMAVVILVTSNHERTKEWPIRHYTIAPNVLLNIANQFQNIGLLTMIGQGLAIAWWRKAMQGASLGTLHRNHAYSYSVLSIITSGKHFNIVALAALMTKFAVIDSTLFQKATKMTTTQQVNYSTASMTGWVETTWPANRGGVPGNQGAIKTVDAVWAGVINAYSGKIANGKMHDSLGEKASFFGCPYQQECSGAIKGLGFAFQCNSSTEDVDYGLLHDSQRVDGVTSYPLWNINFSSVWASNTKPYASINMNMLYVDSHAGTGNGSCPGTLTRRQCEIRPAVVQYPVTVMTPSKQELLGGNIVTHVKFYEKANYTLNAPLDMQQIDKLEVLEYVDLEEYFGNISTVGGLTYVLNNLYGSSVNLTREQETDWNIVTRGSQAQTTFFAENDQETFSRCYYDIDRPGMDDPAIEILRKINTLGFVAGLYWKGQPTTLVGARPAAGMANQTTETSVTGIVEEYTTNYGYMAGAIVATFVTVFLVLPVYWGFWQLGRKVTLGPLEIANAFNAPVIAPTKTKGHHGDFDEVLQEVGKRRVQYGQLLDAPPGQMGIAEPHRVARPSYRVSQSYSLGSTAVGVGIGAAVGGAAIAAAGASNV